MSGDGSVTDWIQRIQRGEQGEPQDAIFDRFFARLAGLARRRLGELRSYEDEQDVALSAMKTFFRRAPEGRFLKLSDRNSLWSLLAAITLNKATSLQRRQFAEQRDRRRVQSLEAMLENGPSEELLDSVIDEGNLLLDALSDESLRTIAQLRMEGYTNQEIADQVGISLATVKRKLSVVRRYLEAEFNKSLKQ
jgi:DNA-directed RNA polymerase specialized sigma24 family protein